MKDWIIGMFTLSFIGCGAFVFAYFANPYRADIDRRKALLRACSWDGGGRDVYCDVCGDKLTVSTIDGMTEDGLATCYLHTGKKPK